MLVFKRLKQTWMPAGLYHDLKLAIVLEAAGSK